MEINVKNMVCDRCIRSVTNIFRKAGLEPETVRLGLVKVKGEPVPGQLKELAMGLREEGFEILDDYRVKLTDQIKKLIIELVYYKDLDEWQENLSEYLSRQLHRDYNYLSTLFSSIENTTIEQYFILQKIERVKEWLVYDEFTLTEIAFKLGYSSVAHLSSQFKRITGFTPSQFKKLKEHNRIKLDDI